MYVLQITSVINQYYIVNVQPLITVFGHIYDIIVFKGSTYGQENMVTN